MILTHVIRLLETLSEMKGAAVNWSSYHNDLIFDDFLL